MSDELKTLKIVTNRLHDAKMWLKKLKLEQIYRKVENEFSKNSIK